MSPSQKKLASRLRLVGFAALIVLIISSITGAFVGVLRGIDAGTATDSLAPAAPAHQ